MVPELSVVLPVRNQADHIGGVVQNYLAQLKGRKWEYILVPNACTDNSPRICQFIAKKHKSVRVVENPPGGWGLSVRVGLKACRGKFVSYANSARTDPTTLPLLFNLLKKNAGGLAKVSRYERHHFLREMGSALYNLECRLLFGVTCHDVNGTPKMFSRQLLKQIELISPGDLMDAELLAHCARLKIPILELPQTGWSRHGGKSTTGFKSALRMYQGAFQLRGVMK